MIIYANLVIPILFIVVMLVFFKKKVVWWEHLLVFGIAILAIFISKWIIETSATADTEYWGGYVVEARYYEAWDEEVPCTHSYDCMCSTDKDGNECCCSTCYDHAYDVDDHGEYWLVVDSNGKSWSVSQNHYNYLVKKFGTKVTFKDMRRDYHSYDGDMYYVKWDNNLATLEPTVTKHKYENKVRVSSSVYALAEPDTMVFNMYDLFHYPDVTGYYDQVALLGYNDSEGERRLQLLNALSGREYQFKAFVLIYRNQPRDAAFAQDQQWQGTNKNEFVVCIGIDDNDNVQWAEVLSWTESFDMETNIKSFIGEQEKLNVSAIADELMNEVNSGKWVRKEFEEFSYLKVEPSMAAIFWTMFITTLVCGGVGWYVVANDIEEY